MKMLMIVICLMSSLNTFASDGYWMVVSREIDVGYGKPVQLSEAKVWVDKEQNRFTCVNDNWIYRYSKNTLMILAPNGINEVSTEVDSDSVASEYIIFTARIGSTYDFLRIIGGENYSDAELAGIPEVPSTGDEVAGFKCW